MTLSAQDLARIEIASRVLVSPLASPDPKTWLAEAGEAVRSAVGGTGVVLQMPPGPGDSPFFSLDAAEVARGSTEYLQAFTVEGIYFTDPVVDLWNRLRRHQQLNVFGWDVNMQMVQAQGLDPDDSPIVMDVLQGQRFHDFVGMIDTLPAGETMIWVLHQQRGGFPLGEHATALLRALYPAFQAGLAHLAQFDARRATLDVVADPLAAFSLDGRELHRNTALTRLLAAEPERIPVEAALLRLARHFGAHARVVRAGAVAPTPETVRTRSGAYTLRPTLLPPGSFGTDPTVLVAVDALLAPALPTPDDLRTLHGLTRREAEVALLLAEGLTNGQIADRLFVSQHTARHHVENVMAKLGLTSRAAVAARILGSV